MQTVYMAEEMYSECDGCEKKVAYPESACMWAEVLANGGEEKVYPV